jgi:AraC-like DNA-binding protein
MEYVGRTPAPPLDRYIERIWYCSDAPLHASERVLPGGGTLDLVVNLAEDALKSFDSANPARSCALAGALILGSRTRSFSYDPRQRASLVGAHFKPGAAFLFLGISPREIVDAHAALEDVWGCMGRELRERLLEARSTSERFRLLEQVLLSRLRSARPGHPAARAALTAFRARGGTVRVAEVAAATGLSHRRFVEVFEREVGLTPKLYARLQRFHHVKQRLATRGAPASWAAFALERGYSDQSHLIRDFVAFSGLSPEAYLEAHVGQAMFDHLVHAYREQPAAHRHAEAHPRLA